MHEPDQGADTCLCKKICRVESVSNNSKKFIYFPGLLKTQKAKPQVKFEKVKNKNPFTRTSKIVEKN